MAGTSSSRESDLERWLKPFLGHLGHKARRRMCPLYVAGLIGPGDRKSVAPSGLRLVTMISCIILLLVAFGRRRRWKLNSWSRLTSLSAVAMRCW